MSRAHVAVGGKRIGEISDGLVALVGFEALDGDGAPRWGAEKVARLRVFEDENGRLNRSVLDVGGAVLAVPNFTVAGDTRKGRRPSFDTAMPPERAAPMFDGFVQSLCDLGVPTESGRFRASMRVELVNEGPITLVLESSRPPE